MNNLIKIFIFILFLEITFLFVFTPPFDFDLGSHLRYGEYILTKKQIPSIDFLTYTYFGQTYTSHEWLFEVLTFLTFQKFSFLGLTVLSAIIGFVSFYFLTRLISNPMFKILAVLFAGLIASPIFMEGLRPQLVGILGASFLIHALTKSDKGVKKYLLFLPLIFLLWGNAHASFVFGLAILGFYWLSKFFQVLAKKKMEVSFAFLTVIFSVTGLASMLNFSSSFLIGGFLYLARYILSPSDLQSSDEGVNLAKVTILEWLPPPLLSYPGLFYLVFILIVGIVFVVWFKKFPLWQILTIILFSYLAGLARRHLAIFAFTVCPITLSVIEKNLKVKNFPRPGSRVLVAFLLISILFLGREIYQMTPEVLDTVKNLENFSRVRGNPYSAVVYLRSHPQKGNMYNIYNWGGYLDWQLPELKVFVDGRLTGSKPFVDSFKILHMQEGWYETLESYNVSWVIVPTPFKLVKALVDDKGWQKVYEDSIATIAVRPPPE